MEPYSKVGVVDKVAAVLRAIEAGPCTLAELVERSRLPRATAHRLATALVSHRLLSLREGRYRAGSWLSELAGADPLSLRAQPVLDRLRDQTGCSAQLYRRRGDHRLCVAASDVVQGLRDTVPVGSLLPMTAGSAAQALLCAEGVAPPGSVFTAAVLSAVRRRGWAHSVAERAPGVASVSAPIQDTAGTVVAAVSVSGPVAVLGRSPGRAYGAAVSSAALELGGCTS